jgi:hypothetical protein
MIGFTTDEFKEKETILNFLKKEFEKDPASNFWCR